MLRHWQSVLDAVSFVEDNGLHTIPQMQAKFPVLPKLLIKIRPGIYAAPILNPDYCQELLLIADAFREEYKPNEVEQRPYQIPELVLDRYPQLTSTYNELHNIGRAVLWPLFGLINCKMPNHFTTIQLAKYNPMDTPGGNWHHDEASEYTATISLDPSRYEGGGTRLRPEGALRPPIFVPPLPAGYALLFNGRQILHEGVPVTKGDRDLLVYWMVDNDNLERWK